MLKEPSKKTGIYFLIKDAEVVYIGKTTDYPFRLKAHVRQQMDFDSVRFIECAECNLDSYEKRWINKFKPVHNGTHKGKIEKHLQKVLSKPKVKIFKNMHFRKLTEKSGINFGNHKDWTVADMIKHGRIIELVDMYFNLSHITFFDDILETLKITSEWRIDKPGTDKDKGREFKLCTYPDLIEARRASHYRAVRKNALESLKYSTAVSRDKAWLRDSNRKS